MHLALRFQEITCPSKNIHENHCFRFGLQKGIRVRETEAADSEGVKSVESRGGQGEYYHSKESKYPFRRKWNGKVSQCKIHIVSVCEAFF